ncbi:HEAT repeat domain-containing protein [bacterium]|nr:HEAT repeat domain-containing protein [bacterium]
MIRIRMLSIVSLVIIASLLVSCAGNPYSCVTTLTGSKGPAAKVRAAKKLAGMKGDIYVDALVKALYDPHQRVIIAAADALGETGDPKAIPHLEKLLSDGRGDVSKAAASALSRIRDVSAAEALLRSDNSKYRSMGIDMLGRMQLPNSVPALAFILGDRDTGNRLAAVKILRRLGTEEATAALKRATQDPDAAVRAEAVKTLSSMEGSSAFVALSASSDNSIDLAKRIERLVLHFIEQDDLRSALAAEANSLARYMVYYCTNYVQQDMYSERDQKLTQLFFEDTPEIIVDEMELISSALLGRELTDIAQRHEADYVQPGRYTPRSFLAAVKDEGETNEMVIETIRYLEMVIAADSKSLVMVNGRQPSSRQYALMGLSFIDSAATAQALLKSASRNYYDFYIVRGLVDLGFRAKQALISASKAENAFVRSQAMLALAFLPDVSAIEPIAEEVLKTEADPIVRLHSQFVLYQAGRSEMFDEILKAAQSDETTTALRASYLLWYAAEPVPEDVLLMLLGHSDYRIRRRAGDVCAKKPIASAAIIDALVQLMDDKSKLVRISAAEALAAIDRPALPVLQDAASSSNRVIRKSAARALVTMGGDEAVRLLLKLLGDSSSAIRAFSAQSLGGLAIELGNLDIEEEVRTTLRGMLDTEKSTMALRGCIVSLGKLNDVASAKKIIKIMEREPETGKEAALALAMMLDDESVKKAVMLRFRKLDTAYMGFSPVHSSEEYRQLFFISYPAVVANEERARKRLRNVLMQGEFKDRIAAAEFMGRLLDRAFLKDLLKVAEYESKSLAPFDFRVRRAAQRAAIEILLAEDVEAPADR